MHNCEHTCKLYSRVHCIFHLNSKPKTKTNEKHPKRFHDLSHEGNEKTKQKQPNKNKQNKNKNKK